MVSYSRTSIVDAWTVEFDFDLTTYLSTFSQCMRRGSMNKEHGNSQCWCEKGLPIHGHSLSVVSDTGRCYVIVVPAITKFTLKSFKCNFSIVMHFSQGPLTFPYRDSAAS